MSETRNITSGTKEWATSNVNIVSGCPNDCRYCYARKMAIRFGRKTDDTWKTMELNMKAITKNYRKRKGRIMFPSSHDIVFENLEYCCIVLKKLLKAGNEVLITSKPNLWCIFTLLNQLESFKDQIQFRFTITSRNNQKLRFWEPKAPDFEERLQSLELAFRRGFKTSISIEPFLDKDPLPLIIQLAPFVSDTIWIGKMNYIQVNNLSPEELKYYDYQREICSWSNIEKILFELQKLPESIFSKIRIKDSIKNMNKYHVFDTTYSRHRSSGEGAATFPGDRFQKKVGGVSK